MSAYSEAVLKDAPHGYWRLGEKEGITAADSSGQGNNGSYENTPALGAVGGLLGDSDTSVGFNLESAEQKESVVVPDAASLDLGDVFTYEAWIKRNATGGTDCIIDKGVEGPVLRFDGEDHLLLRRSSVGNIAKSTTKITDTRWHHVVATKNGEAVHIYIDGKDVTGAVTNQTCPSTAHPLNIGADEGGTNDFFRGWIDEAAVYPTALSAERVKAHYEARGEGAFSGPDLAGAAVLDSLIREAVEELRGKNWHNIYAGTGDGTPTGWTQSEGEANATARWWIYGFPASAFAGLKYAVPLGEGQEVRIALMDDKLGNAIILKIAYSSAEQYFYSIYEETEGAEGELLDSGFVPRVEGDRFYLSVEEGSNGIRAWRKTGAGEPEVFAESTLGKSLEAYGAYVSLYLLGKGTFRGTEFTALSLNPETPPEAKATPKMRVALNGGGYGSTEPADLAAAVHMVRFDTEAHSVENLKEMLAAGLLIHALFPGPYNEAGVSAIEPDKWVADTLAYYEANLTPATAPIVEVLNEPHGSWFWGAEAQAAKNQAAYRTLVQKTYEAFHAKYGDEAPKIVAAVEDFELWWEPACATFCDGVVVHPYGGNNEAERASSAEGNRFLVEEARQLVTDLVPVYVTEVGWPTAVGEESTGDSLQWTEAEQAANITNFYNWARGTGYIAEVAYFQYHDYGTNNWYGVVKGAAAPYEHKAGYTALQEQAEPGAGLYIQVEGELVAL